MGRWLTLALAGLLAWGCAYNATGLAPPKVLIFEASIGGEFLQRTDLGYYFVLDTNGNPDDGPLVNGSRPLQNPYPDPRSYLPFVRDEDAILDREPIQVPKTHWSTYFALYEEAGQLVCWQGRPNDDGTVNERARQMQKGREWAIVNGRTWQLTLPFTLIRPPGVADDYVDPAQWEGNLAVAYRTAGRISRQTVIERWGQVPNFYFPVKTSPVNQAIYDPVDAVTFPENMLGGSLVSNLNFTQINYRVVAEGSKRR